MNVTLVPHDPLWASLYASEIESICLALGERVIATHHIGSTAIPAILAKPIIDILIEVRCLFEIDKVSANMELLGYETMGEFGIEGRRYFRKDNACGVRTHHVHIFDQGSAHLERHIAFRDYLIAHPSIALEYSELKAKLTRESSSTQENYIDGKSPFIQKTESQALSWHRASVMNQEGFE
jgi:GrpB-like predicted nucleotidyltransferase (UPF0157 family)